MTPAQIEEVETSFRLVAPIAEPAAKLFYDALFAMDPELKPLFAGVDMAVQGSKLMAAIGFVVGHLRQPEAMLPVVRDLGRRHGGYGVRPGHYATVGAALLATLEQGLGEAFTPARREAWATAYGLLAGVMIEAAEQPAAAAA
jgi:hemoglobin-like flavoprotein